MTLGQREEEIVLKLEGVVRQMIEHEHTTRQRIREASFTQLEDRIHRSFGILSNARVISSKETMERLSDVRLGIDMGLISGVTPQVMNELMVITQPGFLQIRANQRLDTEERDIRRAEMIREQLSLGPERE